MKLSSIKSNEISDSLEEKEELQKGLENNFSLVMILGDRKHQLAESRNRDAQQMFAIGTAMVYNPKSIILDESSYSSAPKVNEAIACTVDVIQHQGVTSLLSDQKKGCHGYFSKGLQLSHCADHCRRYA